MIDELYNIERLALMKSPVHRLDARTKIILAFTAVISIVAYPYSRDVIYPAAAVFIFFALLWLISGLPIISYFKRLCMILPFGIVIIVFQIFFKNGRYDSFTTLVQLPFGIGIYAESVEFACILFVKFLVCISFIILLSSTTTMQDMLKGAGRLGMPAEFSLIIGLMVRYLFVFAGMYRKIINVFETRFFNAFDTKLPYRYRLSTLAYAVGTLFVRAYEQGERTYVSMLCRGYSRDSFLMIEKKKMSGKELCFLIFGIVFIAGAVIVSYLVFEAGYMINLF